MTAETKAYEKTILVLHSCSTFQHFLCAMVYAQLYIYKFKHYRHTIYIQDKLIETKKKVLKNEKRSINN